MDRDTAFAAAKFLHPRHAASLSRVSRGRGNGMAAWIRDCGAACVEAHGGADAVKHMCHACVDRGKRYPILRATYCDLHYNEHRMYTRTEVVRMGVSRKHAPFLPHRRAGRVIILHQREPVHAYLAAREDRRREFDRAFRQAVDSVYPEAKELARANEYWGVPRGVRVFVKRVGMAAVRVDARVGEGGEAVVRPLTSARDIAAKMRRRAIRHVKVAAVVRHFREAYPHANPVHRARMEVLLPRARKLAGMGRRAQTAKADAECVMAQLKHRARGIVRQIVRDSSGGTVSIPEHMVRGRGARAVTLRVLTQGDVLEVVRKERLRRERLGVASYAAHS